MRVRASWYTAPFLVLLRGVVARWNLKEMSTDTQRVTLQSPKISNDDDKQSTYRLMNALCRAKAIFADFSNFAHSLS